MILTQDDIRKCRQAFKHLDHDNSGSIEVSELRPFLKDFCTPEQIEKIIEVADTDGSNCIDFAEFLRVAQQAIPGGSDDASAESAPALKDLLPRQLTREFDAQNSYESDIHPTESYAIEIANRAYRNSSKKRLPKMCYCIPLIDPMTPSAGLWQIITGFAIVYAALMTPVLLAFDNQLYGETKENVLAVDFWVNNIFIIDIIFNFCAMYYDANGVLVTNPKAIACKYIRTWFFPDVISCIPLDFILGSGGEEGLLYAKLSRMGKFAKVFRLLKMLKMMKLLRLFKFFSKFDRMFQKTLSNDKYEGEASKTYQFFKFCVCALLVAHVAGCLWVALARFEESGENSWIVARGIDGSTIAEQYLTSMYFIITTLTTVGYGDISAGTSGEIVVAILLMMGGVLCYSIAVGTVSSVLMQEDERQTIVTNKMQTLAHFARDTNMDLAEYRKISRHIKQKYSGKSLDWMEHLTGPAQLKSLLTDLPVVLRAKMLRHMHHGRHLELEFFSRYKDDDLFAYVVPLLSSEHFHAQDMIYLRGDYAERMYFLTKGLVVFFIFVGLEKFGLERTHGHSRASMDGKDTQEIEKNMAKAEPFQVVMDGSTFGDFEVLLGIPRQECVRSDIESECLKLHKKDLLRTLAEFPSKAECLRHDAKQEYHATLKRKLEHAQKRGIEAHELDSGEKFADEFDASGMNQFLAHSTRATEHVAAETREPYAPPARQSCNVGNMDKPIEPPPLPPAPVLPGPPSEPVPVLPTLRPGSDDVGGKPAIEGRLEIIEKKQEELMEKVNEAKEQQDFMLREMRKTLLSMDLRIQSLVLRT